jgi:hypothetical protein
MSEHSFGGPWTEIKLDTVVYYLKCYTAALSAVNFDLWYIDAFAGTGEWTVEETRGGIHEGTPVRTEMVSRAVGPARRGVPWKCHRLSTTSSLSTTTMHIARSCVCSSLRIPAKIFASFRATRTKS